MKKMKKHLLKRQQLNSCRCPLSATNEDGTRKKIKCNDDLCKHRRHKKKRKHKRHVPEKEDEERKESAAVAVESAVEVPNAGPSGLELPEIRQLKEMETEDTEETTMDSYSAADDLDYKDPVGVSFIHIFLWTV